MHDVTASIRPKAVCVCRRGEAILVGSAYDASKGETFYGPPGGGVEFGERAIDAVRREMREELEAAVCDVTLLGVLENIFTYEGQPGHEIVFVFEARFVDASFYEREEITGVEGDQPFVARWKPLAHFGAGGRRCIRRGCWSCSWHQSTDRGGRRSVRAPGSESPGSASIGTPRL